VLFFSLSLSHRHHHLLLLLLLLLPPPFYLFYLFNSVHVLFPSLSSLYTLISGAQGNSLLHQCLLDGNQEGARFLIEHGARLDEDNHEGDMPLHFAIRARFAEIVKLLLQKGSPVNHQGRNGECPLHTAATQSDADLIDILLAEPNVDLALRNYQGHTPFWWVVIGLFVVCWLFVCLFVCLFVFVCVYDMRDVCVCVDLFLPTSPLSPLTVAPSHAPSLSNSRTLFLSFLSFLSLSLSLKLSNSQTLELSNSRTLWCSATMHNGKFDLALKFVEVGVDVNQETG
jgi:Ankyrin repeats (3 copies)